MAMINRRRLLCLGIGTASVYFLQRCGGPLGHGNLCEVSRSGRALGCEVTLTVLHSSQDQAERAIDAALAELALVESLLSIYRSDSQVSRLNRDGKLNYPHEHLLSVLKYAQSLSRQSGGAFDVTVQPLWQTFRGAQSLHSLPDESQIEAAKRLVDYRQLHINSSEVRLDRTGATITLNGIAQGYAADRVAAVLREHGVRHALASAGEMLPLGISRDGDPWTVGIQHPRRKDAYVALIRLDGRALATSGDYATTFSDDYRHHHLLDPRTGSSPGELASVSVVAASGMEADALSTAVFVLGVDRGLQLVRQTAGADAFLVLKDGTTRATAGFPFAEEGGAA